ncbi:hypothetical protein NC239_34220 [Streptomyces sp. G3]|uniref:hypothetical protein n=1 Tax=Streptomyces sp. G3 TaxID=690144 RepID=UPI00202FDFD4|nr:hypothetical protein [Streptomyces sp. G3]MCM1943269.1 hypothetical protein [Streptomyces sp. G3]
MAPIAVVLDHTTAGALYDPKDPFRGGRLVLRPGLRRTRRPVRAGALPDGQRRRAAGLARLHQRAAIHLRIEAFDTDAAVTATELLRFGHSWAAVHAIHAARPSAAHPAGRFLLTLTPKAYAGTGVQAVHPDQ